MQDTVLAEGKTKQIIDAGDGVVLVRSKDDITAGDGARRDVIEGKAVVATTTTCNVFTLLESKGITTHFLGRVDERTFRAHNVDMIPLELVVRRLATGSFLKRRPDVVEGTVFGDLVFEFFEKDDEAHDPLLEFDIEKNKLRRFVASRPRDEALINSEKLSDSRFWSLTEALDRLRDISLQVFQVIEAAWSEQGVTLVDLKIECGFDSETGELMVADVIDNDSWRIWPGGDKAAMKDKQVYRDLQGAEDPAAKAKELGAIKKNYVWVAEATGAFVS